MKNMKKTGALILALALLMAIMPVRAQAAGQKTALDKTKVTLMESHIVQLRLKNAPKGKTVKWSSSKKSVATVTIKGIVVAKKAGTAKITATVAQKKYTCTVTVQKLQLTNTKGKNAADVKALTNIIRTQHAQGAWLPTDLNSKWAYEWDANGRLTGLNWRNQVLAESLSLKGLSSLQTANLSSDYLSSLDVSSNTALRELDCGDNQLSSLDVSSNTALRELNCCINRLSSLDVSKNVALEMLNCNKNQLSSLDVSSNTALTILDCYENQLSSLDVSGSTALEKLYCDKNQLSSLDVSSNTALRELDCGGNQLSSLDLSSNTLLTELRCDKQLVVTGYDGERLNW